MLVGMLVITNIWQCHDADRGTCVGKSVFWTTTNTWEVAMQIAAHQSSSECLRRNKQCISREYMEELLCLEAQPCLLIEPGS